MEARHERSTHQRTGSGCANEESGQTSTNQVRLRRASFLHWNPDHVRLSPLHQRFNASTSSPHTGSSSCKAGSSSSVRLNFSYPAETSDHGRKRSLIRSPGCNRAADVHTLSRMLHKYTTAWACDAVASPESAATMSTKCNASM